MGHKVNSLFRAAGGFFLCPAVSQGGQEPVRRWVAPAEQRGAGERPQAAGGGRPCWVNPASLTAAVLRALASAAYGSLCLSGKAREAAVKIGKSVSVRVRRGSGDQEPPLRFLGRPVRKDGADPSAREAYHACGWPNQNA